MRVLQATVVVPDELEDKDMAHLVQWMQSMLEDGISRTVGKAYARTLDISVEE